MLSSNTITQFDTKFVTMSQALLLFYLVIAGNQLGGMLSRQLMDALKNDRMAQHIVGLVTMLTLVVNFGGVTSAKNAVFYTVLGYIWFLMTTKLDLRWNLILLILMVVGFLYETNMMGKEKNFLVDQALTNEDKERILNNHRKVKNTIVVTLFTITLIGFILYYIKKRKQYGIDFNASTFMLMGRDN